VKNIYLRRADFTKHGWTEGCAKCRFMILHPSREGGPVHSDKCKERLITALKTTAPGRARVQQAERRLTDKIAKHIANIPLRSTMRRNAERQSLITASQEVLSSGMKTKWIRRSKKCMTCLQVMQQW
jgi:hypothetical protein